MKHCGMDVHMRSTTIEVLDPVDGVLERRTLATRRDALRRCFAGQERMRVALEASGVSQWVADVIEELGHEVVVVDPFRTSAVAVAGGYKKTDALDAATLAWLSSKGAVVASYRPSAAARHLRRMLAIRSRLLRSRGDMVRTVRGLLAGEGIVLPRRRKYRGFSAAVRVIEGVDLSVYGALLETIDTLDHHIRVADARIIEEADKDSVARRLMTADGIGPISALAFRALIENPHRFRAARQVASYIGLAPAVYNSARTKRLGHISGRGDKFVRATLVEAANSLLHRCRRPSTLRDWGLQLKARVGAKKAAVAGHARWPRPCGRCGRTERIFGGATVHQEAREELELKHYRGLPRGLSPTHAMATSLRDPEPRS